MADQLTIFDLTADESMAEDEVANTLATSALFVPNGHRRCPHCRKRLHAFAVAELIGVSFDTVLRMTKQGRLTGFRLPGGHLRFRRDVVEAHASRRAAERLARGPRRQPPSDYAAILAGDPCSYCGRPCEAVDHIDAVARGGENEWTNLTAACAACNTSKWAHPLLLFLLWREVAS